MKYELAPDVAGGSVLRGVLLAGEARPLARPVREAVPLRPLPGVPAASATPLAPIAVRSAEAEEDGAARRQAYQDGFDEGRRLGEAAGRADGLRAGQAEGREEGLRQGLEQGRQQGHAEGVEQGRATLREAEQAQAELQRTLAERVRQLDALLAAVPAQVAQRLEQCEPEMLGLCFDALAQVLGQSGSEGARALVRQALAQSRARGSVTVRVHPRDLEAVRGDASLASAAGPESQVHWLADERVQLGGCVIASPEGGLDARLETQLARLAALLAAAQGEAQ